MNAWMNKVLGEGNWNQEKGKKMTADRGRQTAKEMKR
jgi:hypothetical protein